MKTFCKSTTSNAVDGPTSVSNACNLPRVRVTRSVMYCGISTLCMLRSPSCVPRLPSLSPPRKRGSRGTSRWYPGFPLTREWPPKLRSRLAYRAPDALGRGRHFEMRHAERVGDGADDGRGRGRDAGLAGAFDAERVAVGRHRVLLGREIRQIARQWHRVIHEAAGEKLTVLVEDDCFHQRLTDALRRAAMHLALDDHRIDDAAGIVDRRIADDADAAELGIDLNLAGRGAIGMRMEARVEDRRRGERPAEIFRQARILGARREIEETNRAIGAGDGEAAIGES